MAPYGPFRPVGSSVSVAASTQSALTSMPKGSAAMRVFNSSGAVAFFRTGVGDQLAVATDTPLAPNSVEVFTVPEGHDCFACILASSTGTIYVTRGEGL